MVKLTFRCNETDNGILLFKLFAEHVIEFKLSKLLSWNWKLTCMIFVHKLKLHWSLDTVFPLFDNELLVFVSKTARFTSGLELIEAHVITYVVFLEKSFVRLSVWFA